MQANCAYASIKGAVLNAGSKTAMEGSFSFLLRNESGPKMKMELLSVRSCLRSNLSLVRLIPVSTEVTVILPAPYGNAVVLREKESF